MLTFSSGDKYFLLDCGGGTVDSIVHMVTATNGAVAEADEAGGGPWGSQRITAAFEQFISDVVGKDVFNLFAKRSPLEKYMMMDSVSDEERRMKREREAERRDLQVICS